MNIKYLSLLFVVLFISCSEESVKPDFIGEGVYSGEYFPTNEWRYCSPEDVGADAKALEDAHNYILNDQSGTDAYMIVKNGYIIAEDYSNDFAPQQKHASFSIAKSFTSALIGIAIDKGYIKSVEDKLSEYYEELNHDTIQQWKKDLKIWHALTMTSGIEWTEEGVLSNDLILLAQSDDFVNYVINKPIKNEPGTVWSYNSGESMYLSGLFNKTTGKSMFSFAKENLLNPIGIKDINWTTDSKNQTIAGWGIKASMHDFAKFGYLYLNEGNWDGTQIISKQWVATSTSSFSNEYPFYAYLWWLKESLDDNSDGLPENIYMAIGALGQYIIVIPSQDIVIVRLGQDIISQNSWSPAEFIRLVLSAF